MINTAWVREFAGLYLDHELRPIETRLLEVVGPAVRARGFVTKPELEEVGEWKSPRARARLASNPEADVQDITRFAMESRLELRVRLLGLLAGVQRPMAAAILTVADPDEHTMFDVRVQRAAPMLGLLPPKWDGTYASYVRELKAAAQRLDVSLRDLDRAVFEWDKRENGPLSR